MVTILISLIVVWAAFFMGYGQVMDIATVKPMTINDYYQIYMGVGGASCLSGAIAAYLWFNAASSFEGFGDLGSKYRTFFAIPLVVGIATAGYLVTLGADGAALCYVLTALAGLLVYIISACISTPSAGKAFPPFG